MINYVMLGTNDLQRSADFYDRLLTALGASRAYATEKLVAWSFGKGSAMLTVTTPFDGKPATVGNGVMVALNVEDSKAVDTLHAKALELGAMNEGAPGLRGKGFYAAYFRDPDGNKLNVFCYQ
jgi:predicted lactoylglutathione lyase